MEAGKLYIGGEFCTSQSQPLYEIFDPARDAVITKVHMAGREEVEQAIQAARTAFDAGPWRESSGQQRATVLLKIAAAIREQADELAELETLNMGKPIIESEYDIADAATCFEYFAGWATKIFGDVNPVPDNAISMTMKEPIGVCGLIIPWNYPLLMAAWKIAPALAAGCTLVLKPAEETPLTALALAKICDAIPELPKGVVNIISGTGEVAGALLAESPLVDKIAFTGSTEVGRLIMAAAARTNLKKVTLELGGKSPNIFFADADFESAVDGALFGCFINQGEVCSCGSRILVEDTIYDRFVETLVAKASRIKIGAGMNRETKLGPLVTRSHLERVLGYVDTGVKEGATLAYGGSRLAGSNFDAGYYLQPAIFTEVDNAMTIAREEIFGPVASVIRFNSEADAIQIANDSPFGLAGAVWTRDIYKAFRVVKSVRAGTIWVNHMQPCHVEAPWGGYKQSGTGRELGRYGIENFLESKQVYVNLDENPIGWY